MELQEIFDKVATHLLKQGVQAGRPGACRYRDDAGNKCAVGCLIPDDKYSEEFEGRSVHYDSRIWATLGLPNKTRPFVSSLQSIHDLFLPTDWKLALETLAAECNLSTEAVR